MISQHLKEIKEISVKQFFKKACKGPIEIKEMKLRKCYMLLKINY